MEAFAPLAIAAQGFAPGATPVCVQSTAPSAEEAHVIYILQELGPSGTMAWKGVEVRVRSQS
jgi:hypothetical protein